MLLSKQRNYVHAVCVWVCELINRHVSVREERKMRGGVRRGDCVSSRQYNECGRRNKLSGPFSFLRCLQKRVK